jgi:hypothetical protein
MTDVSMERLEPTARVPEPQGKQPRRDPESRSRRRPEPPKPEPEPAEEPEQPQHQLDRLG